MVEVAEVLKQARQASVGDIHSPETADYMNYMLEQHERDELAALPGILHGCERFIDVGANIGLYTLHAVNSLRNAQIVLIEANPQLIPMLKAVVGILQDVPGQTNSFAVENAAIFDEEGPLTLHLDTATTATASSIVTGGDDQGVTVQGAPLDAFYVPSRDTVIKLDIEGAEHRALRSASRFLASDNTRFFVELHGWGDRSIHKYPLNACWMFLRRGYSLRRVGNHFLFTRERSGLRRFLGFARVAPGLFVKWVVYRFAPGLGPRIRRIRNFMS